MEKLKLSPATFGGNVHIPPSKSFAHRALICGALSGGNVNINNMGTGCDLEATVNFIRSLGMELFPMGGGRVRLQGELRLPRETVTVDCIESGSTLRFIIPIMAALGVSCNFTGQGLLPSRPIGIYRELLPAHGISFQGEGLPCSIEGKLTAGDYSLPGNISSQFISGLMFALPLLKGDSRIIITTELQSESYLDITLSVLKAYGIDITKTDYGYFVPGDQRYMPTDYTVEGDWSQAAFFMNLGAFSREPIYVHGLNENSIQGDKKCLDIYRAMGVRAEFENDVLVMNNPKLTSESSGLKAIELSVKDIPDTVPALAVAMSLAEGRSLIRDAARLRIKESDRLRAITEALNSIGGRVTELPEGLVIEGVKNFSRGETQGRNDHRIVMAVSTAAAMAQGDIFVTDPYSINKSYPQFYEHYNSLGGKAHVIDLG